MNTNDFITRATTTAAMLTLCVAGAAMTGCRGERSDSPPRQFIPDMDDTPKFRNQSSAPFFADGRSMRPRVPNTVAFGDDTDAASIRRAAFLKENPLVYQGFDPATPKAAEGDPAYAAVIPAAAIDQWIAEANVKGGGFKADDAASRSQAISAMIKRGQDRFNIYCSACHGYEGDGRGLVGVRWMSPVPTFHDAKYKDRSLKTGKDGYLFHTILHGVPDADPTKPPKMPAYSDKIHAPDAWAIVAYMRALQAARTDNSTASAGEVETPVAAAGQQSKEGRQ